MARDYSAVPDVEETVVLAKPLGRVSDLSPRPSTETANSRYRNVSPDANMSGERTSPTSKARPSPPRTNSGIVFGSPRRSRHDSANDQKSGKYTSISPDEDNPWKAPQLPASTLAYPRRVPDETERASSHQVHATPANNDEHYDEKNITMIEAHQDIDDEEEMSMLLEKAQREEDAARKPWVKQSPWSKLTSFLSRRSVAAKKKPVSRMSWIKFIAITLATVFALALAGILLFALNLRTPHVYWKGTLTDSTGSLDATGFNFTRHISLGFTNPNLFRTTILDVETVAAFNGTHYFGHGVNDHVNMDIVPMNRYNATLPLQMDFSYLNGQDPDHYMLQVLYDSCSTDGIVPFDLMVRGKVKFMGTVWRSTEFGRIAASMSCDNNMAILVQSQYASERS